ncbi:HDIG domain-containing protein [Lutispora thermophila DSM 19022]|uniref:HDIG domain-containing protein n=1 Tax=Lutispora thermophila DSM 19022 TaxID=1122184 RepID=A0A1M6APN0_9FIRM|nr:HDIG domain-containing protein [Lutispora thermophila DSM 19022]
MLKYIVLIVVFSIFAHHYYRVLVKNNTDSAETIARKTSMDKEQILTLISLQRDEIEALYKETYTINNELTNYIKKLNESKKELQDKNQELSALYTISKKINSNLNIDTLFQDMDELLKGILAYDILAIMLLDDEKKFLIVKYWNGPPIEGFLNMKFAINGKGVCALCVREKRALLIKDVNSIDNIIIVHDDMKQEMVAPIMYNGEVIGVFIVDTFKENAFDEHKLSILCSFASLASTALYNAKLYSDLKKTYEDTAKSLAKAIEAKDTYTRGHCDRVTELSVKTANYLGLSNDRLYKLKIAAILHDIGKIGIPEGILNKPGILTSKEYSIVKKHPSIGYEILSDIEYFDDIRKIIYQHHERFDGKGYPLGVDGRSLLTESKILALADAFDAMTSERPYRKPFSVEKALEEIKRNSGTQFDPDIASAFIEMMQKEH